jgi:hypothetical protein
MNRNFGDGMRIVCLLIILTSCTVFGFASDSPLSQPVATLDLSELLPAGQGEPSWATVAFSSETAIAVGLCRTAGAMTCSLSLVRWENGTLQRLAQTLKFDSGTHIHPASGGQILGFQSSRPTVLYSADLSTLHELPKQLSQLWLVSPSGKTLAASVDGSWKLYRLTDTLEPLREGTGDMQSVSDEIVVIQDGKTMKIETLEGKQLGSFSVPRQAGGYYSAARPLGDTKLYLDDCNSVWVVGFDGSTELQMHPGKGCSLGDTKSSADGQRLLFDFTSRKVPGLEHAIESARTIATLGMAGAEDANREWVRVFDTLTGGPCFDWHRSFSATYSQVRSAAISPSGEYVAIAAGSALSIYRLPAVCEASTGK